jgi:hypothetical protein
MPLKPGQHLWMLVGGVVIHDGVDNLAGGNLRLDGVEKADALRLAQFAPEGNPKSDSYVRFDPLEA